MYLATIVRYNGNNCELHIKSTISVLYMSYPLKKAPDRAETSGDPLKSVIG